MKNRHVSLQRASVVLLTTFGVSLALAGAGLVGVPVGDAVQTTAELPIGIHGGEQVGHSIGRIQKLEIERASVTLKHGPIPSLGMPDMTMIFRVANPRQLTGMSVGDKVSFEVRRVKGAFVISKIAKAL